jgi:hypothetical protein
MIVTALTLALAFQGDKLEENFGKLQEAWKAAAAKSDGLTDDYIRAIGKLSNALEAAGCFDPDASADARAVKRLLVRRAESMQAAKAGNRMRVVVRGAGGAFRAESDDSGTALERFEKAVAKQRELKEKGIDDEDNLQEVLVKQRKALKDLGIIADEMPQWIRRRVLKLAQALATGAACPAFAKATPEQEKRVRELVAQLGDAEPEKRDEAARELDKIGEPAVPQLREALKHGDAEVRERAKKILGIGLKDPEPQSRADRDVYDWALQDLQRAIELVPADKKK